MTMGWNPSPGGGGAVDSVFTRTGAVVAAIGDYTSEQITDPTFGDVKIACEQLDALALTVDDKADSDSPTFTGDVNGSGATTFSVPTPAYPDSSTKAASTAFVSANFATSASVAGKVDASGGTLTNGTIAGPVSTSVTGTLTAAAASVIDLDGAASVVVPTVAFPSNTTAAASTAFVTSGLATKINASGGTLSSGTINGSTTLDGTLTASATALLDLDAAGAEVRVPTVATSDSSTKAASTEWIATREDPSRYVRWSDECLPGVIASTIQWAVSQNGAGASVSANPATLAGAWGHRSFTTGTTNSGRAALSWETVAGQLPLVSPWTAGTLRLEWRVQLAALPTAGEDFRFSLALGTGAGTAGDDFTSGIGIRCDSTNANWVLASRVLASDIATQTLTFAVAAATWTWVILDLTSTTATVYMDTTRAAALAAGSRGSVTMVGATGVPVGPMSKLRKTVGNTARLAYQEFHRGEFALTTPR